MDIYEFIIGLIAVLIGLLLPIYAIRRAYDHSDEKVKVKQLEQERELEEIKQENYLLENKQMRIELDQIKAERREKGRNREKSDRWLIEDEDRSG